MASAKELRDRIKAVQETKKITGAMHLISSTKLRRAKADFAQTRVYFDALRGAISEILHADPDFESRYFRAGGGAAGADAVTGVLVITADKGLAGAYNLNVLHAAEALRASIPNARLFVVGEYGRRYFAQHAPEAMVCLGGAQTPTPESATALSDGLLARYDAGELDELLVIYTDMKNSLASEVRTQRLLPLPRGAAEGGGARTEYLPSADEVVRMGVRSYLRGFVYGALLDSYCAEQNARVTAMEAANRNAQELLEGLSLQLNRQRQAAITREITEISAGAQAQRNAGKKKEALKA